MIKLLIIADDFTGALDTGVQFAAFGAAVKVITNAREDISSIPGCEVLVVDTETRHISSESAYQIVEDLVQRAKACQIPHIYKKTDSALRGNVGAELAAVLTGSGEKFMPFLPSFPQIGRSTRNGVHYIQDVPVAESVFGEDPFEPVRNSVVTDLLAEQTDLPARSYPAVTENTSIPKENGIAVFDAETLEDLRNAGKMLSESGRLRIMAGCAGMASVLSEYLDLDFEAAPAMPKLDSRLLVICGSVNPITVAQMDMAEEHGFVRHRFTPEQKMNAAFWEDEAGKEELQKLREMIETTTYRIIDTNDERGNQPTLDYAAANGLTIEDIRQGISKTIGYLSSQLFDSENLGTMLVTGGDTLLQCMNYMGIHRLRPICELDHGVVLSRFHYKERTQYVITKSGGFGKQDLMLRIAEKLQS